jgi:UDP:flavonoid glycosyltransferase YjiC (YdhE family)
MSSGLAGASSYALRESALLKPITASTRRQKIILFPLGCLLSHVGRLIEVGKALRARGHEVVFAGEHPDDPRSKLGMAERAGFRWVYAQEPDYRYAWDRFVKYGWTATAYDLLRHQHWAPLDQILQSQIDLIEREQPDLVVGDATISVSTAAHITGIPAAGVMNGYAADFVGPRSLFMPLIHAWDATALRWIRRRVYRKHAVRQLGGLRLLRNTPLLSPDLPGLYPPPDGWPHWHTVGPIFFEPDVPMPDWFDELGDETPNVYITMGSTGILDTFLRRSFEALGRLPYRFVVTTGGQASEETLAMAPANFRLTRYAPGSKLLERCQALIFHGGNGSMYQALAAGVPMIALPSHLEQVFNFRPILNQGFGAQFSPRKVHGAKLASTLVRMMEEPACRAAAGRYSKQVRASDGPGQAAELLERIALARVPAGA